MAFDKIRRLFSIRRKRWGAYDRLCYGIVAALLLVAGNAHSLPPEFSAYYQVQHSGLTLGEAEVKYRQVGPEHYRYSSYTRPLGLAAMILRSEVKEISMGRITDDGFRPDRYEYDRSGRGAKETELRFDWSGMRVINTLSGDPWDVTIPQDTLDRMVSQLQLMHDLAYQEQDLVYRIADRERIKEYNLRIMGRETVDTPYGSLKTIRIVRERGDNKRSTTFWCAPALEYLPVQIAHREKSREFVMTLQKAKGFAETATASPEPAGGHGLAANDLLGP